MQVAHLVAAQIPLVIDGRPAVDVVIPAKPLDNEKLAAEELSYYLGLISGLATPIAKNSLSGKQRALLMGKYFESRVPVVTAGSERTNLFHIYVGRCGGGAELLSKAGPLAQDEFIIRAAPEADGLNIAGYDVDYDPSTPQGFQEQAGGARSSFNSKENRYWNISFERSRGTLRGVYTFLEEYAGVRWYMPGPLGEVAPQTNAIVIPNELHVRRKPDFTERMLAPYPPAPVGWWGEYNLWLHRVGAGSSRDGTWANHTLQEVAQAILKDGSHPEWLAADASGKRAGPYLCLTAPGLPEYIANWVVREFTNRNLVAGASFPVMPWDGYRINKMCRCQGCAPSVEETQRRMDALRKESDAGLDTYWRQNECGNYVWPLVAQVAEILKRKAPQIKVTCGAYGSYCLPEPAIVFPDNMGVQIALGWPNSAEDQKRAHERFAAWAGKVKHLSTWEYACWHVWYNPEPVIWPHAMAKHIQAYRQWKVEGIRMECAFAQYPQAGRYFAMDHINHYVMIKCLLDANRDVDALLADYYVKFYGPAARPMRQFFERQMRQWDRGLAYRDPAVNNYAYARELMDLLRQARRMTPDGTVWADRLDAVIADYTPWHLRQKQMAEPEVCEIRGAKLHPTVDGNLGDSAWSNAARVAFTTVGPGLNSFRFTGYAGRGGQEDPNHGWGACVRVGDELFFAVKSGTDQPNTIAVDCSAEVVLAAPDGTRYVLRFRPNGKLAASRFAPGVSKEESWKAGAQYAAVNKTVNNGQTEWYGECRLPMSSLSGPLNGEWRINWGGASRVPAGGSLAGKPYGFAWHAVGGEQSAVAFNYDPRYYGRIGMEASQ